MLPRYCYELCFWLDVADFFRHLITAHLRHVDVSDDDIGQVQFEELHGQSPVCSKVDQDSGEFSGKDGG